MNSRQSTKINRFAELLIRSGAVCTLDSVMNAAYRCDVTLLRTLVSHGADPEARNDKGATPLIIAAKFGDLETIEQLIGWGVDINAADHDGLTAAQWAIASGQFNALALLTTNGAELPVGDDWSLGRDPPEPESIVGETPNIFRRDIPLASIYEERLIHLSLSGVRVRSKSELLIADALFHLEIPFEYETPFWGSSVTGMKLPDFTFRRLGAPTLIIWEHLGMLSDKKYLQRWETKLKWYKDNGLVENRTLFITSDDSRGGLDSNTVYETANKIRELIQR